MRRVLGSAFFDRPTLTVAHELLGKVLVRRWRGREIAALITEVEAYDGHRDLASHASKGKTRRNAPMFGPAGHWYVYFIYGMYWMLNVVTGPKNYPAAVLIRGVAGIPGPGILTKQLRIAEVLNGGIAGRRSGLWIEDRGIVVQRANVQRLPRIGVAYAGAWAKKPYRFLLPSTAISSALSTSSTRPFAS